MHIVHVFGRGSNDPAVKISIVSQASDKSRQRQPVDGGEGGRGSHGKPIGHSTRAKTESNDKWRYLPSGASSEIVTTAL